MTLERQSPPIAKHGQAVPVNAGSVPTGRIDGAHEYARDHAGGGVNSTPALGEIEPADARQHTQAEQILHYLREQHADLDRREARFNSQMAEFDDQARRCRLWLQEQYDDLAQRQAQAREQAAAMDERDQSLQQFAAQNAARERELADRALLLAEIVLKLQHQRQSLREQSLALQAARQTLAAKSAETLAQFAEREAAAGELLKLCEESLRGGVQALAQEREQLDKLQADRQHEWRRQVAALRTRTGQLEQRRSELELAAKWIEQRQASLENQASSAAPRPARAEDAPSPPPLDAERLIAEQRERDLLRQERHLLQLQAQLREAQRETLEMRLATEELWARMTPEVPSAALQQALAEHRLRLTDVYRLALVDLRHERQSLDQMHATLGEQEETIAHQRRELEDWQHRRQAEFDAKTAELAAQASQLQLWQDRLEHQQEQAKRSELHFREEIQRLILRPACLP